MFSTKNQLNPKNIVSSDARNMYTSVTTEYGDGTGSVNTNLSAIELAVRKQGERMAGIEKQLMIVTRDIDLEEEHIELRKAWDHYNETLDTLKTFHALRNSK